jgi:hypothetical protein
MAEARRWSLRTPLDVELQLGALSLREAADFPAPSWQAVLDAARGAVENYSLEESLGIVHRVPERLVCDNICLALSRTLGPGSKVFLELGAHVKADGERGRGRADIVVVGRDVALLVEVKTQPLSCVTSRYPHDPLQALSNAVLPGASAVARTSVLRHWTATDCLAQVHTGPPPPWQLSYHVGEGKQRRCLLGDLLGEAEAQARTYATSMAGEGPRTSDPDLLSHWPLVRDLVYGSLVVLGPRVFSSEPRSLAVNHI